MHLYLHFFFKLLQTQSTRISRFVLYIINYLYVDRVPLWRESMKMTLLSTALISFPLSNELLSHLMPFSVILVEAKHARKEKTKLNLCMHSGLYKGNIILSFFFFFYLTKELLMPFRLRGCRMLVLCYKRCVQHRKIALT